MKIGFIYGPFGLGGNSQRFFDLSNLWVDQRGLTGSELSFFRFAQEMSKLGHDVQVFTFYKGESLREWNGIKIHHFGEIELNDWNDFDAVCSWNESDPLRHIPNNVIRLVNLQINSFTHCRYYPHFVDVWTSPSESHRQRIINSPNPIAWDHFDTNAIYTADPDKWVVLFNGCDPELYDIRAKVKGRVIWASSPDRGLHWLLQEWPKIKKAVPHAHLKIFYNVKSWIRIIFNHPPDDPPSNHDIAEQRSRANYINEALRRLRNMDVELVDSVSRQQIAKEMSEAEVLAYSCDTVNWTEGFSVTLMEACAAGAAPITFGVDALGSIYGGHIPAIQPPVENNIDKFTKSVIRTLADPRYRENIIEPAMSLAQAYRWDKLTRVLERLIMERLDDKRK